MAGRMVVREYGSPHESSAPFNYAASLRRAEFTKDSLQIDMEIKFPKREERKQQKGGLRMTRNTGSILSNIFSERKCPEPVYFESVDCVAFPHFVSSKECGKIIDFAEAQGFCLQKRHQLLNMMWADIVDPFLAEALWHVCGLDRVLHNLTIHGEVPCGLNDVIRVQKFQKGGLFGRHTDQPITRADGRTSRYSLRIFLNGKEEKDFEGGLSAFHVAFQPQPVLFEPEVGLALLYPQGEYCQLQEETEVLSGCKYVLRADVLFQGAKDVVSPHIPFHHPSPSCG